MSRQDSEDEPVVRLPRDLAGALRHLTDAQLDDLARLVTAEAQRRGSTKGAGRGQKTTLRDGRPTGTEGTLTEAQANLIRAAARAGVRPSTIARQFGFPLSTVKTVMAGGNRET